jgi:hypothetical protein
MIQLSSMAVSLPHVEAHPNRRAFRGVLTTVDSPSTRAPSGAKGHLVVLTKKAAEDALPSLLGMALDYAPTLDRHGVRRKVGVITRAEIVGRNLELGGYLFARDFPEIVEEIETSGRVAPPLSRSSRQRGHLALRAESALSSRALGLSYEVTNVQLADARAKVWTLEKVTFTGAAILRRDKAAYRDTWIELSA